MESILVLLFSSISIIIDPNQLFLVFLDHIPKVFSTEWSINFSRGSKSSVKSRKYNETLVDDKLRIEDEFLESSKE